MPPRRSLSIVAICAAGLLAGCGEDQTPEPAAAPSPGRSDPASTSRDRSPLPEETKPLKLRPKQGKPATKPERTKRRPRPQMPAGMSAAERGVVELTNAERAKAGCRALRADSRLWLAAERHSKDMVEKNYFSHTSKDGSSPWDRIKRAGYNEPPGAENIAAGQPTAQAVVKAWMNSEGHRANILNCSLKAVGVGEHEHRWTQAFGRA